MLGEAGKGLLVSGQNLGTSLAFLMPPQPVTLRARTIRFAYVTNAAGSVIVIRRFLVMRT
jgi:hypothetical protein